MPSVRKLNPEEVRAIEDKGKGVRKLTGELYNRGVASFEVGDYGELTPDHDEKRLAAQSRPQGSSVTPWPACGFPTLHRGYHTIQGRGAGQA